MAATERLHGLPGRAHPVVGHVDAAQETIAFERSKDLSHARTKARTRPQAHAQVDALLNGYAKSIHM